MPVARRIISLLSSATEMLFAVGVGERIVAISHECDYPAAALGLPRVTRSLIPSEGSSRDIDEQVRERVTVGLPMYRLDAERIGELQPDLIVTQSQCDVCAIRYDDVLNVIASDPRLAETRVVALNPHSLEEVLEDVLRVGEAAGAAQAARDVVQGLRARIQHISSRTESLPIAQRPRTLCIEWLEPLMRAANWTPDLIRLAGGENGLSVAGEHSQYCDWEVVARYDPEVVLISPCGFDLPRTVQESQVLRQVIGWSRLSAVRTGRVYAVDGNAYLNRAGPRLVDSLEILAHLLQPQLFPEAPVCARHAGAFCQSR